MPIGITLDSSYKIFCEKNNFNFYHSSFYTSDLFFAMQGVSPAELIRRLRQHRSQWADYNFDAYSASALKASPGSLPGLRPMRFSGNQIILPLANTVENEEVCSVLTLKISCFAKCCYYS